MSQPTASEAVKAALKGYAPSDEQWQAIRAPLEPVVIAAGAGSGKTAVMTARIVHLVESGQARPASVLGLTFTNKAAGELEERLGDALGKLVPHPQEHPTVMTYHAFAQKLVRDHGARIGVDPEAALLSNAHKWQLLMGLIEELDELDEVELRHPLSFIPQTLQLSDQCADHLVSPEELAAECDRILEQNGDNWVVTAARKRKDFAKIIAKYAEAKQRLRRIDYGDQIRLAVEVLERHPAVVRELREHYPVVLLDEYQDTNPGQKVMLRHLCPDGWAVTAVGDARQAIYAWRGASMFNLINFHREFRTADGSEARRAALSENFRSGRRIVELANRIIEKVPPEHRPGAELVPVEANGEAFVGAAVFADQEAEAAFIADEIERLHDDDHEWRDCAVLVRTRRYLDRIVAALEDRDIPYEIVDLGGLLRIPAVVDTMAWLRLLYDRGPASNRWAARILMGPRFRVHYGDLAPIARHSAQRNYELMQEARELLGVEEPDPGEVAYSLVEALEEVDAIEGVSDEARERVHEFLALLEDLRPHTSLGLQELAQIVVDRTGIADALAASTSRTAAAMRDNLNGFIGVCSEFAPLDGEANLGTFIDFLDVAEESEDPIPLAATATSDSVKVLTVHAAKGLEFRAVFVPVLAASQELGRYDGMKMYSVFPDVRLSNPLTSTMQLPPGVRRDRDDLPRFDGHMRTYRDALKQRAEEDERRLFYVALTRARERLYCSAAWWYGAEDRKGPSVFCDEVLEQTDLIRVLPGHCRPDHAPLTNPVVEEMRRSLVWPPSPERDETAAAWLERVEAILAGQTDVDEVLAVDGARPVYEEHLRTIEALQAAADETTPEQRTLSLSATAAVRIALGKETTDNVLYPVPQRPTEAQRLGTEVHAWIEERARGLVGLADEEALDTSSLPADRATAETLKDNYVRMGYDERTLAELDSGEPAAELPFTLKAGRALVRGRIDAVYLADDGLEIVDFKTGQIPDDPDWGQLELYAEALAELGLVRGGVTLTYAYLRAGEPRSRRYTPRGIAWLEEGLAPLG